MMKVKHGNLDLWGSITFLAPDLGETSVTLENQGESITLLFEFVSDAAAPKRRLEMKVESTLVLRILCTNFDDPFPIALNSITQIGDFIGRKLHLGFTVTKVGSPSEVRQVHVSAYLGENVRG